MKTLNLVQETIAYLASLSAVQLQKTTIAELRSLIRKAGVSAFERDGQQLGIRSIRKGEALDLISKLTVDYKLLQTAEFHTVEAETERHPLTKINYIINQLENDYERSLLQVGDRWVLDGEVFAAYKRELAARVNEELAREFDNWNTRSKNRSQIRTQLVRRSREVETNALRDAFVGLAEEINNHQLAEEDRKKKNDYADEQRKSFKDREVDKIENYSDERERAIAIIKHLPQKATAWKDVAYAVALLTGARMYAEVMCETAAFLPVNGEPDVVQLVGKSKEKGDRVDDFNDSYLIHLDGVTGLEIAEAVAWLTDKDKRSEWNLEKDGGSLEVKQQARKKANDRYSKAMSEYLRGIYGVNEQRKSRVSAHDLRRLYVEHRLDVEGVVNEAERRERGDVLLGHNARSSAQTYLGKVKG
jgi:hypothetical protein